jgi:Tetratricopeptide repeat
MIRLSWCKFAALISVWMIVPSSHAPEASERKNPPPRAASVDLEIGHATCKVDLDNATVGATGPAGALHLPDVQPGDHYIHVDCPGQREKAFFISPARGQNLLIKPEMAVSGNDTVAASPIEEAEKRVKLNHAVQQAVRLRARGELDQAVRLLREATRLDPENSDLHRELGITFLLGKDWARARVEMLEAVRHDPQDADAHNGLGYALDKLGDLDGAVQEFRTATHLEPDDSSYQQHYLEALGKIAARQAEEKEKQK